MTTNYDVLVAGAGPVGLMLANELRLAGVRVLVAERRTEPDPAPKAEGINTASTEALDRRGLLAEMAARKRNEPYQGKQKVPPFAGHFGGIQVPAGQVDRDHPLLRGRGPLWYIQLPQVEAERILEQRLLELGGDVRRGVEVCGLQADDGGVTVHLSDGDVRVGWLVGADGAHSVVRREAGFDFPGTEPMITVRTATGTIDAPERFGVGWQHTANGLYVYGPRPGWIRTVELTGPPTDREAPMTAEEMEDSLRRVTGFDVQIRDLVGGARFTDHARQSSTYRNGRVLLCGDAAHVHSPFSGQGLNLGIGDAINLGWKLAATVHGWAPSDLLDTYTTERHPIGAWVLDWTRAQVGAMRGDVHSSALRQVVKELLYTQSGATYYVTRISGLWQQYEMGEGHPLVGFTVPAIQLRDGSTIADHAHAARPLLIDFGHDDDLAAVVASYGDRLDLLRVEAPESGLSGLLMRPDGFVAWAASEGSTDLTGLVTALTRWFGAAANSSVPDNTMLQRRR